MYRLREGAVELLLAHPGGPFWARKDVGAWSIPKGQYESPEEPLAAACREFVEETGFTPQAPFLPLGEVRQKSGKRVQAWAFEGDCDCARLQSNTFEVEWPPHSGRLQTYAEVDRVEWFDPATARVKLLPAQQPFVDRLLAALAP